MFIKGYNGWFALFLRDGHRYDLRCKAPRLLGRYCSLLATQGKGILIGASDAIFFCDIFRRLSHAVGMMQSGQFRIDETPTKSCVMQVHRAAEGAIGLSQHKGCAGHALS